MARPVLSLITICLLITSNRSIVGRLHYYQKLKDDAAIGLSLVRQQHYDNAIEKLQEVLEVKPNDPDALTYLATAKLYKSRNFIEAEKSFEEAFRAGGGAAFWVNHSHEKLANSEMADYCHGWLHLRKNKIEFVPENSDHSFSLGPYEITEVKQNRLAKSLFHLQYDKKTLNFKPRTGDESEVLLILILYKKFVQ